MDITDDPLYQFYCNQIRKLKNQHKRTNRRQAQERDRLRWEIKDLEDKRRIMRGQRPECVDYGLF